MTRVGVSGSLSTRWRPQSASGARRRQAMGLGGRPTSRTRSPRSVRAWATTSPSPRSPGRTLTGAKLWGANLTDVRADDDTTWPAGSTRRLLMSRSTTLPRDLLQRRGAGCVPPRHRTTRARVRKRSLARHVGAPFRGCRSPSCCACWGSSLSRADTARRSCADRCAKEPDPPRPGWSMATLALVSRWAPLPTNAPWYLTRRRKR